MWLSLLHIRKWNSTTHDGGRNVLLRDNHMFQDVNLIMHTVELDSKGLADARSHKVRNCWMYSMKMLEKHLGNQQPGSQVSHSSQKLTSHSPLFRESFSFFEGQNAWVLVASKGLLCKAESCLFRGFFVVQIQPKQSMGICSSLLGDTGMGRTLSGSLFLASKTTMEEEEFSDSSTSSSEKCRAYKTTSLDWDSCLCNCCNVSGALMSFTAVSWTKLLEVTCLNVQGRHVEFFVTENATMCTRDPAVYNKYSMNQETLQCTLPALNENLLAMWQC